MQDVVAATIGAPNMPRDVSALQLVLGADPALMAIVALSMTVSLLAVAFASLIGLPVGAAVALPRFPGREAVIVTLNALMGLPPVVVGLAVYLLLSRSGPLGSWGLLFTPQAMVIAQTILVAPIIAGWRGKPSRICGLSTGTSSPRSMSGRSAASRR
jgi:tungstate transport system permease protein